MSRINRREAFRSAAAAGLAALASRLTIGAESDAARIVRLTTLEDVVYAPKADGEFVESGKLDQLSHNTLAKADSKFWKYLKGEVEKHAEGLGDAPVVVMVHGFMADPREQIDATKPQSGNNPHAFSFHFSDKKQPHWRHTASWPRGLGLTRANSEKPGLPIAFGWNSMPDLFTENILTTLARFLTQPKLAGDVKTLIREAPDLIDSFSKLRLPQSPEAVVDIEGSLDRVFDQIEEPLAKVVDKLPEVYRQPYRRASHAAWALVNTIRALAAMLPGKPIDLFCHSLGSRVVLLALRQMAEEAAKGSAEHKELLQRVGRVILIGGAEYSVRARAALKLVHDTAPDGGPSFYNFMARRDRVLYLLAQKAHPIPRADDEPAHLKLDRTIGLNGLDTATNDSPRWIDLQLDDVDGTNALNDWLAPKQLKVAGTHRAGVLNHWHYFTDENNMKLYRAILHDRPAWAIAELRRARIPERLTR